MESTVLTEDQTTPLKSTTTLLPVPEQTEEPTQSSHLYNEYKLAEYNRLGSELEKQMERRDKMEERAEQMAGVCASAAGVAISVGIFLQKVLFMAAGATIPLCACALIVGFLAMKREQIDMRIAQIQWYIRHRHERRHLPNEGWDDTRKKIFGERPWFPQLAQRKQPDVPLEYHELAARRGLSIISSLGQFLTLQGLFMFGALLGTIVVIVSATSLPLLSCVTVILIVGAFFFAGVAGIVLTCLVMEHKRPGEADESD